MYAALAEQLFLVEAQHRTAACARMLAILHGKLSVYEYETDALRLLARLNVVFIGFKRLLIKHHHIRKVAFFQRAAAFPCRATAP